MQNLKNKSVTLVGYGATNRSLLVYFMKNGIYPTVRCKEECSLPRGIKGIFGKEYLMVEEDIVFRSPGIRADKIPNGKRILTEAIFALNKSISYKIGITGSDGKTTSSTLIHKMLQKGGKTAFLCGNIGDCVIDFADVAKKDDFLVTELSSFQLMGACVELDVAVITNITENHLDWHLNMEEYIQAKKRILENAKRAVLNYDDPLVCSFGKIGDTYFSSECLFDKVGDGNSYVYIKDGFVYFDYERLFPVKHICLKGDFNIKNVLCAVGCAYPLVGKDACYYVARTFSGVENRQEHIGNIDGVNIISSCIDSTPSRTVNTLSAYPKDKIIAILGGYDKNLNYECLRSTLSSVKGVILCGENREKIWSCIDRSFLTVNTIEEALQAAIKMAKKGDFIILSPASASFDMFENYKEKAKCFKRAVENLKNGKH